jgi:hypothetical protein
MDFDTWFETELETLVYASSIGKCELHRSFAHQ